MRQTNATFVYTRQDGAPVQPRSLSQMWASMPHISPEFDFTIFGMPTRRTCYPQGYTRKWRVSGSAIARLGSRWTSTATSYRGCKRTQPRALTKPIKSRKRGAPKKLGSKAVAFADFGIDHSKIYPNNFNGLERWQSGRMHRTRNAA